MSGTIQTSHPRSKLSNTTTRLRQSIPGMVDCLRQYVPGNAFPPTTANKHPDNGCVPIGMGSSCCGIDYTWFLVNKGQVGAYQLPQTESSLLGYSLLPATLCRPPLVICCNNTTAVSSINKQGEPCPDPSGIWPWICGTYV